MRPLPDGLSPGRKQLVVTADDFGAAAAVNEAVERAHLEGVLSAASLMVGAEAAQDAVARARRLPGLRVGLHLVLVEGRPVSDPADVPDLVTAVGDFRTDLVRLGADIVLRPALRRQLACEIEAQFCAYAATGLPLDHVNTHKHFHLHPTVRSLILSIGPRYGMRSLRVPDEPRRVLDQVDPPGTPLVGYCMSVLAGVCRRGVRRAGVATPDQVFGLAWSGAMTSARLAGLIARLPPGLTEIYLHPATEAYAGSAPGYAYQDELQALVDPQVRAAVRAGDVALGGFADFAAQCRGPRR